MIELQHIDKIYPTLDGPLHTLQDVSLSVAQGEILGLIGKSGAGKSTLLRCVNLLERPTNGAVIVNHTDLMQLSPKQLRHERHKIGMVFQHFNLLSTVTVFDNVAFPLRLLNTDKNQVNNIVLGLLEEVGLLPLKKSYPHQLSGGQKQRVAIARALATNPTVLLCDEMTSALDPETTADILALVRQINKEHRLSILCVTHEMGVVKNIADRVAVIDEGKIVECDSVLNVFKQPKTAIAKRFTQSVLAVTLPDELKQRVSEVQVGGSYEVLLRVTFTGHATLKPMMNELVRRTDINVNIFQANIEQLQGETIGVMVMSVALGNATLQQLQSYFQEKQLDSEVLGYVDASV